MILKLIIILVRLYYLLLLLWFGKNQKDIKPINKTTPKRARSIIGKSTYIVTIPLEADQTTPQNYAEPMQVDFEIEYDDEEEDPHDVEMQRLMDKYDKLGFPAFYISTNVSLYKLD
jgi:hypothetical protein